MGEILTTLGAILALIVFILIMIGGVMFVGSLFGGVVDWLMEPARRRDEARTMALQAELAMLDELRQSLAPAQRRREQAPWRQASAPLDVMTMPKAPLATLRQHETRIAQQQRG